MITMVRGTILEDNSFLLYAVDITERIIAERKLRETDEQIRQLNVGLEEKVRNRTEELEQANRELEAFSFSVSHDLRAPLRHIEAFTRLIEQSPSISTDPKLHRYFSNIGYSVHKMNTLIDSLLSFSRTGRSPMVKKNTSMDEIVKVVLEEMEQELEDRNIDIHLKTLGDARVDANLIRQVWYNLISNAIKFTRNEKKALVSIGKEKMNGREVFFVKDNGAGFDPSYKSKLFGVFQRLHSESEFEGTGIGLANVKRIIERHGGKIWAEGNVGRGAEFYFHLP